MAAEGSSRAPLAVLSVLLVVAVGLGVRAGGAGDAARWERLPAPAAPLSEAVPPRWPPAAPVEAQILGVFGEPGPVLPTPEALWVPTGFGLRRIPLDGGRDLEIATPGLARRVIRIGDDSLWVADGHGGVAAFRWTDNDLAPLPGLHPGKVFDLVSCGDSALASVTEGLLLRLAVDDAGSPREVARLVVDGRPTDLSVVPVDGGCRWALALKGGGLVTGRAGSAIAAELGTIRVTEQIDALEVMAVNPVQYLVTPRLIAGVLMMPCLCVTYDVIGMFGSWLVGVQYLGIDSSVFWSRVWIYVDPSDILNGLFKAACFGAIITTVGCYRGFHAGGGAEGVGRATTQAVVIASVSILISDYFITSLLEYGVLSG